MKKVILIGYPTCSTCKKAIRYIKDHEVEVEFRHIVEDTPSKEELRSFWQKSALPLKKFSTQAAIYIRK